MTRRQVAINNLRRSVDCLPLATKRAMLEGINNDKIIVGAYTDGDGGVCPMLSAHRRGGRTNLLSFARNWDIFTSAPQKGCRPARPAELEVLRQHLIQSLRQSEFELTTGPTPEFSKVIAEHQRRGSQPVSVENPAPAESEPAPTLAKVTGPTPASEVPAPVAAAPAEAQVLASSEAQAAKTPAAAPQAAADLLSSSELFAQKRRTSLPQLASKPKRVAPTPSPTVAPTPVAPADSYEQLRTELAELRKSLPKVAPTRRIAQALPSWMQPLGSVEDYENALALVDREKVRLGLVGDTSGPHQEEASSSPAARPQRNHALRS